MVTLGVSTRRILRRHRKRGRAPRLLTTLPRWTRPECGSPGVTNRMPLLRLHQVEIASPRGRAAMSQERVLSGLAAGSSAAPWQRREGSRDSRALSATLQRRLRESAHHSLAPPLLFGGPHQVSRGVRSSARSTSPGGVRVALVRRAQARRANGCFPGSPLKEGWFERGASAACVRARE